MWKPKMYSGGGLEGVDDGGAVRERTEREKEDMRSTGWARTRNAGECW